MDFHRSTLYYRLSRHCRRRLESYFHSTEYKILGRLILDHKVLHRRRRQFRMLMNSSGRQFRLRLLLYTHHGLIRAQYNRLLRHRLRHKY